MYIKIVPSIINSKPPVFRLQIWAKHTNKHVWAPIKQLMNALLITAFLSEIMFNLISLTLSFWSGYSKDHLSKLCVPLRSAPHKMSLGSRLRGQKRIRASESEIIGLRAPNQKFKSSRALPTPPLSPPKALERAKHQLLKLKARRNCKRYWRKLWNTTEIKVATFTGFIWSLFRVAFCTWIKKATNPCDN